MSGPDAPLAASFRDPAGCLFSFRGRIFRIVNSLGAADLRAFLDAPAAQKWLASGRIVRTQVLDDVASGELLSEPAVRSLYDAAGGEFILEHERIPFPSYPYEWAPGMLHAAGLLTLDLARDLLPDHIGLKDGTPYNVLFRGPDPVFIDLLSFERRDPHDPTWLPYAQFVRTFVLPLLANRHFSLGLDQTLTTRRDGLEPEEVYRWTGPLQRIRPPFLSLVSMPTWLGGKRDPDDASIYRKKPMSDPERAAFVLESLWNGLGRSMARVKPRAGQASVWSDYMVSNNNYSSDQFSAKQAFVEGVMQEFAPASVLDVGCNTGHFSALAARHGARVVAIDYDPVVVGDVWRNARQHKLDILPLAVNLTRPTPGIGWRNAECSGFLDRARGAFDAVFMLAVIHHMLVTERVPLPDILALAAELTTRLVVVEYVDPADSMFRRLTRGRDELHKDLNSTVFENVCRERFEILRSQRLEGASRWLYLLKRRTAV